MLAAMVKCLSECWQLLWNLVVNEGTDEVENAASRCEYLF